VSVYRERQNGLELAGAMFIYAEVAQRERMLVADAVQ